MTFCEHRGSSAAPAGRHGPHSEAERDDSDTAPSEGAHNGSTTIARGGLAAQRQAGRAEQRRPRSKRCVRFECAFE